MRLDIPNEIEAQWLLSQGVSDKAFAALAPGGALNGLFTSGETSFGKAAENQWASDSNAYGGTNYNV